MTLTDAINNMFGKRASSPAQRAVNAGAPDAAENPTDGQKRVGNYRKVHLNIDGFRISIENPKGSIRSGTSPDGTKWSNVLACDYGDIRGTESVDGDPVDIYLSDHPEKGAVFVIDQIDPKTKKFDEHKVMYGFDSVEDAKKTYLACYQKGWGGLGWITPVSKAEFRKWIDSSYRKTKPFHEYQSVTPIVDPIKVNEKAAQANNDEDKEHPIPEEMKKKFPIGKWVVFPHARMTGKVRKIVGYEYGGKRDNGKDYYCCWLESPDIEDGKRGKVIGLAMYGGYGDHPGPVFDSRKDAQKDLDDKETASGYRAKQEALAKGQEKAAQAYEPPYTIEQIRKVYGDDVADRLSKDPVHKWRAETGIELIHKEPDLGELKRIIANWKLMSDAQKKLSDEKSMELFKVKNDEHGKQLLEEYKKEAQAKPDDPMEGVPQGVKLRSFIDAPATRTAIMDNVLEAVKNRFPIEDDDVRLELRDVKYEGPTSYTLKQQKQALLNNRRLGCSIAGTWRLTDKKTGKILDERRDGIIRVPYYTDRGTIINNGNEYTVISQARLSPGVYVRRKQNGELESQFNVANGLGFRIGLDRETGALNMSIGQGHVPLYPVLHALGVSDDDMRKSWGDEVTSVNIGKFDPRALDKVYARYAGRKADMNLSPVEKAEFVKTALAGSGLDPNVVVRTLGLEGIEGVTGPVILRAAQKLLNINRGAEDPDDRDNPRFSKYYGVEDMMRERIDKDSGRLTKSLLFRAKRDRSLARIARNALAPYLDTFLSGSGLAMPGEEANPLSILVQQSRITRLGEGGISSPDLVTPEARNVQGDYLGYVDFISGPESFGIGIDVRAALGTMKGSDHRLYNKMLDLKSGKTRYVALDDAASHTVAFPGQDPNAPQLYAMRKGVPTMVPRDEVDFMVPGFGNTVSAGINMTPMPTAVQAGRQFYMSKFWEQYLPQKEGEVPLVDSLMDDGKTTYSEFYGRKVGCLTAPFSGVVTKVNDDEIVVKGKDGQTHTASLVDGLPFNRMTSISFRPQVKKGDTVEEGTILANSNFTDAKTGAMNMGRNLKVAVLPAPAGGSSYEDAIVISESAAKKLATSRTYGFEQDTKEGVQVVRNKYLAAFPKAYTKEQFDTIDDNGVVKVGTVLHRDDPMILAIGPKMLSAEDAQLGKLSSVLRNALTDKSQKWEHDWPGVVTDVVYGPNGAKVLVNSEPPVKVGDKLSGEMGLKGVVGCYDSSTEVLTIDGWKCWTDVTMSDKLAVLPTGMGGLADFAHPTALYAYDFDGCLLHAHTEQLDYRVTSNHRMYCRIDHYCGHTAKYRIRTAEDIFGKKVTHLCASEFDYNNRDTVPFDLSHYVDYDARHERKKAKTVFDGEDFAELLGWYISEGNVAVYHGTGVGRSRHDVNSYKIQISQSRTAKPKNCERLEALLNHMGIKWHYHGLQYTFASKPLYMLLVQLGLSNEKHLPEFVKLFSKRQIIRLFEGLMLGDGSVRERKTVRSGLDYITTSPRLARQVEFIMTILGYNVVIQVEARAGKRYHNKGRAKPCNYNFDKYTVCAKSLTELGQSTAESTREPYKGKVYCASVPGGLLYVRRNGRPMWCGNSILPDDKMPRDAVTNETYDMLMNPMGFLSRVAPGQIMLMNLAKVAKKAGKQIRIPQTPPPEGWQAYTERLMAENGVKDTADVFDPQTGRTIKDVGDGYVYTKAFHHLAEKKFSARGVDGAYTMDEQPAKGGVEGSKRISGFDISALLSHGATDVIKDSMTTRGQMNNEYWRRYRLGLPVDEPGIPFIYQKFINTLKAGGVNVVEKGDVTTIMPQTDADIDELAQGRVLQTSQMVDSDFQPVKGGMFDLGLTGGMGGNRWSMITLPEAVPNPMMEEPVRRVLGLTAKKMEAILSGREELNGKTGGDAIKAALANINVDREIEKARADIQNRRGSQRDNAVKVLGYLKAAKEMGKKPEDWMITRVPVLPPMFRPVAKMGDVALVPDMNELYKDLIEMKDNYEALAKELPASALADERLAVYGAVKAAYGLGGPITAEGQAKNLKGAIRQVIGAIPKFGQFQSKVISKTQDLVGRSVITPNRNLNMDQIGIPENMAWEIFKPFVERKLVQRGYPPLTAKNMIDERNATAKHILEDVMEERPVLMDRAPTWHKFNIMAFKPHITEGRSINVCPLVCGGFNADFDGNCVDYDSLLTVRMSKSTFENTKKICDNMLHTNQEKEYAMTDANTSIRIVDGNKVEMTVKIGTFPRIGEPRLDKNGAKVYAVPEGIEVLSVDPETGVRRFEPVTMFTYESDCDTVKVTYGSKSVIVSSNESLAVFDSKEGRLVRVKPVESEKRLTPVLVSSTEKFGTFGDRDLGWLFGAFISDGWSTDRMIGYTKLEKCKREEFVRILRANHENFNLYEYVGRKGEGNKLGDSIKIHCNSATVAEWIRQWKFLHDDIKKSNGARSALFKMIDPKLIESGSEEFLWGLFSGLLDGDGNIPCNMHFKKPRYTFRFNTSSKYLRDDLCRLMHKLGLRYSVTTVKARGWSNESYVVSPSTVDMFGKLDWLSCVGETERSRIDGFRNSAEAPKDDADMVPVSDAELEAIRSMNGFKTGGSLYNTLLRTRNQGAMRGGRSGLIKLIDELKANDATKSLAERVLNINTKWMQISSVEDSGKRDVFDLEVATTKTFVINDGVVVWDTVNIHVPASEKAAKQALDKMLPSKNLFSLTDMKSVRYKPEKEQVSGLWALTRGATRKPVRRFSSKAEAVAAYRNGEIGPNDPVDIKEG